ncbi:MAG: SDR family NAD(P)-dependent oxidoreductase [bacterium]|nr:SDR family NAD(P)-dependent oxidoreductase [bacterium]MDE0602257.1 SDR family NAD(P)-dependent oxidoreductase [bacterium]
MDTRLVDRVALVTGASQGIGRAVAVALSAEGARVGLLARGRRGLEETLERIGPSRGMVLPCDVTDRAAIAGAVQSVIAGWGRLDVLVNNAGQRQDRARIDELEVHEWDRMVEVNLSSVFHVTRAAAPHLIEQGSGSVVNIASISGPFGIPRIGAYAAAKAGIIGLTRTMAAEWCEFGVRVNTVAPGFIETPMNAWFREDPANAEQVAAIEAGIPLGRHGYAEEVAQAVVFLAGDTGSYITGQTLFVDGGWSVV